MEQSASELKRHLESVWNSPGVTHGANLTGWRWHRGMPESFAGEARSPSSGHAAFLNRLRPKDYAQWKIGESKMTCPDWLVERYKKNCPRNWRALVSLYGKTDPNVSDDSIFVQKAQAKLAASGILSVETVDDSEVTGETASPPSTPLARRKKRAPAVAPDASARVPEIADDPALSYLKRRRGFEALTRQGAPGPVVNEDATPRRRSPIIAARAGDMPAFPDFPVSIATRLARLSDKLKQMVDADDIDGLRAFTFPTSSGSRKKLDRYRLAAIIALERNERHAKA